MSRSARNVVEQLTWHFICDTLRLGPEVLPETVEDPATDVRFARRISGVA